MAESSGESPAVQPAVKVESRLKLSLSPAGRMGYILKRHDFSRADKVNQISVGFSHRRRHFGILGEI